MLKLLRQPTREMGLNIGKGKKDKDNANPLQLSFLNVQYMLISDGKRRVREERVREERVSEDKLEGKKKCRDICTGACEFWLTEVNIRDSLQKVGIELISKSQCVRLDPDLDSAPPRGQLQPAAVQCP